MIIKKVTNLINLPLLKLTFLLLFLCGSYMTVTANTNSMINDHGKIKMSMLPVEKMEHQAIVELYSAVSEATIIIFNDQGNAVFQGTFEVKKEQENKIMLDLSGLEDGIYYVVHDESKDSVTYSVN